MVRVEGGAGALPERDGGDRERLIAQRLRDSAVANAPQPPPLASAAAIRQWLDGDAGHLHRAGDLRGAPVASHRRLGGAAVVATKRTLRRLLHPLLDVQSGVNAANARVVTFLLEQLDAQARCIEELQRQVLALRAQAERERRP